MDRTVVLPGTCPTVRIALAVSVDVVRGAREHWLTRFVDQRVSLTDAVSFALMSRHKVTQAFAYDRHFEMGTPSSRAAGTLSTS
jgi:predicted nucleic acid-binding protein